MRAAEVQLGVRHPNLVVPPDADDRAPVRGDPLAAECSWAVMGAHGGAGASTLARWWPDAADVGLAWPGNTDTAQAVVIAARACMPGLVAAAMRLREWHAQLAPSGVIVVGLVLSAARPGRMPNAVRRYRDIVAPLVAGEVYSIGWHEDLVAQELGDLAGGPSDVRAAGARISASVTGLRHIGVLHQH